MPRSLLVTAALATLLTVAACSSAQPDDAAPGADAAQAPAVSEATSGGADAGASTLSGDAQALLLGDAGEPGLPEASGASLDDVLRLGAVATWIDEPDVLAISLPATADCWPTAGDPALVSETQLEIVFTPAGCSEHDTARTYTVDVPAGIDSGAAIEVAVEGLEHAFTLTLPAG